MAKRETKFYKAHMRLVIAEVALLDARDAAEAVRLAAFVDPPGGSNGVSYAERMMRRAASMTEVIAAAEAVRAAADDARREYTKQERVCSCDTCKSVRV